MTTGIVVLDFGGQYAHLIATRIRRLDVYADIRSPDAAAADLVGADGIILSGGPSSVYDSEQPSYNPELFHLGLPILGLCYGHQLICQQFKGQVAPGDTMEYGAATLQVVEPAGVLAGLARRERVWMSHRDSVVQMPDGFDVLGETEDCPVAAMGNPKTHIYGLQFHPEVTHTEHGTRILDNFIDICGCTRDWTMEQFIEESMADIERRAAGKKVFLLVSGGVDSTVSFLLLNRALGKERVLGLHIDNGLMRENETALVARLMRESGFENLEIVDASAEFLEVLQGVAEPEEKRRHIGEEFLRVRDRALDRLQMDPEEWLLGQGTLYTDTIESGGTDNAEVIKTHHNRVPVIEQLLAQGKVIEPLSQLYKDEARELGEKMGLPHHLVWRHPFPGPGLGVRVLCWGGEGAGSVETEVAAQIAATAAPYNLRAQILPLRSVGVQGDGRTYAHPVALHGEADWKTLEAVSTEITNKFADINRVVHALTPEQLPTQKLKCGYLTRERLDLLRRADLLVMEALERHGLMGEVTQMPTVLIPLSSDGVRESIVLRPITTDDFMTARFSNLPDDFIGEVKDQLMAIDDIEAVFYDVTHKPPGTVEWE